MADTKVKIDRGLPSSIAGVLLLIAALIYSGWMMSHGMGAIQPNADSEARAKPFQHDYLGRNGARYAMMARNVLRCDMSKACYAPLLNAEGEVTPDPYLHHPPLLSWVLALVFSIFGETENNARMVPYLFTLLNIVLIFILGRSIAGGAIGGGVCALMAASLPITSYYGAHIDVQGSPLVFCILACVLCYKAWLRSEAKRWLVLCCIFLAVGTMFDWPALYLCLLLPLHFYMTGKDDGVTFKKALIKTSPILITGFCFFVSLIAWLSLASKAKGTSLLESLMVRMFSPDNDPGLYNIESSWKFILDTIKDYWLEFTPSLYPWPFLLLVVIALILGRFPNAREGECRRGRLTRLFLYLGVLHLVLFPFGVLFHDYWVFLLMPWVALTASLALLRTYRITRSKKGIIKGAGVILPVLMICALPLAGYTYSIERFERINIYHYFFGDTINKKTNPGEAVLTNYQCNPPKPGTDDGYVLMQPACAYYADRVLRGLIRTRDGFEKMIEKRDDFTWFFFIKQLAVEDPDEEHTKLLTYLQKKYQTVEDNVYFCIFRLK